MQVNKIERDPPASWCKKQIRTWSCPPECFNDKKIKPLTVFEKELLLGMINWGWKVYQNPKKKL